MKLSELLNVVSTQLQQLPQPGTLELTAAQSINLFQLRQNVQALHDTVVYIKNSMSEMGRASDTLKRLKDGEPAEVIEKVKDMMDYVAAIALLNENVYEVPKSES